MGLLSRTLKELLSAGKAAGKVVQYPDEWIGKVPTNLRKEVASHNEGLLGSGYRESFENAPTFYHGTGSDITEFDVNKGARKTKDTGAWFSGNQQTANTYAGRMGGNVMPLKVRDSNAVMLDADGSTWGDIDPNAYLDRQQYGSDDLSDLFDVEDAITTDDLARLVRSEGHESLLFENLADIGPYSHHADYRKAGSPSDVLVSFDPSNIRSVNAVFDPAKSNSSNILASNPVATAGAGILGLGAAAQSNDTYADYSPSNLARLQSSDVGGYQAPQHPRLASAAMGAGQLNQRGVDDALMQFIAPRLPSELMGKIAYNDERGLLDHIKASAGLLGLY